MKHLKNREEILTCSEGSKIQLEHVQEFEPAKINMCSSCKEITRNITPISIHMHTLVYTHYT